MNIQLILEVVTLLLSFQYKDCVTLYSKTIHHLSGRRDWIDSGEMGGERNIHLTKSYLYGVE